MSRRILDLGDSNVVLAFAGLSLLPLQLLTMLLGDRLYLFKFLRGV